LFLLGVADAYHHLYAWAAPFVKKDLEVAALRAAFEHQRCAARRRLNLPDEPETPRSTTPAIRPANPAAPIAGGTAAAVIAIMIIGTTIATLPVAHAQSTTITVPKKTATMDVDSTTSVFPSVATTLTGMVAGAFTIWADQLDATSIRVATFERDGWLPRLILETGRKPVTFAMVQGEQAIFRGMGTALDDEAREQCNHERNAENQRINDAVTNALTVAWHSQPLVDSKQGHSCTAFKDMLANAARAATGNLVVIVGDTEETCSNTVNPVPQHSAGAKVIIILVPSKTDMGPGVSAAARFNTKKGAIEKMAPWITAILAPAEIEDYRLPIPPRPVAPAVKVGFWQR
jgi:hypothetical protein